MRIRWLGHSAFLLTSDSIRVAIDPFGEFPEGLSVRFEYPPLEDIDADLVLVSHDHFDHNGVEAIGGDPETIVAHAGTFPSPIGEVIGVASEHDPVGGTQRGANTIFAFTLDGLRCCHMGDFGQVGLRPEQREAIGPVDVLFVPVGDGPTIGGEQAATIVSQLRPGLVVPMHYRTDAVDFLEPPDRFLDAVKGRVERPGASEVDAGDLMGTADEPTVVMLDPPAGSR
jgi:L-ascorbate metabolism protein UlaG (beta-lactamase superfamily)